MLILYKQMNIMLTIMQNEIKVTLLNCSQYLSRERSFENDVVANASSN